MKLSFLFSSFFLFPQLLFAQKVFDIEGHRGARGLYPENTITAFIEAVKLGVNTLEMDVVVSKDLQLVVSHEPFINPVFCDFTRGQPSEVEAKRIGNIYQLTYEEVALFDCGSRVNPKFPQQKKMVASKPLLTDVIDTVEKFIAVNHLQPVLYNIETKCTPEGDNVFHPAPSDFAALLYNTLKEKKILSRCIIQSFDVRTLQVVDKTDPSVATALLISDSDNFEKNMETLGFTPAIYSPNFNLVNKELVEKCHAKNMLVIPWTVNDENKMHELKNMGVDGLISDYPDKAIKELR